MRSGGVKRPGGDAADERSSKAAAATRPLPSARRLSDKHLRAIPEHEYGFLGSEELWRLMIIGRRSRYAHDNKHAKAAARMLVAREMPRVRALVATFRFPDRPWVRIDREDRDELAQLAFIELLELLEDFRGDKLVQFYSAIRTCVGYVCMRFLSRQAKSRSREAPDPDAIERAAEQAHRDEIEEIDETDAVEQTIAAIPWEGPRDVMHLSVLEQLSSEQIGQRLGMKANTVDVYRRRGRDWLLENHPEMRRRIAR